MKQSRQTILLIALIATFFLGISSFVSPVGRIVCWSLYMVIVLSICLAIMLEARNPYKTLLWFYAILFFPIIGYSLYLVTGQLEVKGHLFREKRQDDRWYFERLEKNKPRDTWRMLTEMEQALSDFIHHTTKSEISFFSSATVLTNGQEKFPKLLSSLKKAERFIHLEYYIFRSDHIGTDIIDVLCEKAKAGLEVRVIYDGIGSLWLKRKAIKRMKDAGVDIYPFLPLREALNTQKLNFRNHRKIVIVDGHVGFVGGLNIGDEYLGRSKKFGFWRDTHLMITGEALQRLHTIFLMDWHYVSGGEKLAIETYSSTKAPSTQVDGAMHVVSSGPDSEQGTMADIYFSMVTSAKQSVWIATPYFIPNKAMRTALGTAAAKGLDVRLIVPEENDGFFTRYGTQSYFDELLSKGVSIYTYKKGFLHGKVILIDGLIASIGTANVDLRSFNLNFEVNVFLFRSSAVHKLVQDYQKDLEDCHQLSIAERQKRGLGIKLKEAFSRLFSPVL
ncbi:cardiolipin synthase [Aureibacillus halotolerans]|uniref:Cardiolipin synthase n=1 Tax=Aureibacillus halotolerans TaxID=1508390 RepID=A0A4R6TXK9_9BACI|nr:cardiolipin synthase [Aureibacillus halotolerans]TDQ36739.1 cardiolipin synthase [Aureibacillus halotolerans]